MEFSRVVTPSLLGSMVTLTVASSSLSHELNGSDGSASSFLPEEPHKFQSSPTTTVPTLGYATVTYDGMIGVNATDPYAFTTETRSFILPVEIQALAQILMCLFYGTLALTAITSNMIVCYIVLSSQKMRTATNYFIVNLAVGDILMALLCIPFTFPANLIFQYWPFGLSLCVVVSYSAATSVIISAYTMVAISIDKYLAIMYPMRLRMPKVQAKIIILVIWSAALITSLPTALLSRLSPAYLETSSSPSTSSASSSTSATTSTTTSTSYNAASAILPAETGNFSTFTSEMLSETGSNDSRWSTETSTNSSKLAATSISSLTSLSATPDEKHISNLNESQQQHERAAGQPNPEQSKQYFCQESWTFWPRGKYYYSMALMILQFVVPLFVLVITYTRIVIVVWGKRMPGEEDDARDARMARSKRKMIKMVIFCVIAFALTWLPFNALIVIGDLKPDIWEHQNIMYIWFITHYLAMCHTITNPLIYIWMNNRFRAGFKQVIGDLYRAMRKSIVCLYCYCCCFACVVRSSRVKYSSSIARMKEKAGTPNRYMTSSGSANFNMNNYNLKLNNLHSQAQTAASPIRRTTSGGQTYLLASSSLDNCLAAKRNRPASVEPSCSRSVSPTLPDRRIRLCPSSQEAESSLNFRTGVGQIEPKQQSAAPRASLAGQDEIDSASSRLVKQQASSSSAIKRIRIFKCPGGERKRRHLGSLSLTPESSRAPVNEPGAAGSKCVSTHKRHRKKEKQSHVISIQMTSTEYHPARAHHTGPSQAEKALVEAASTSGAAIGVPPLANAIRQHFRKKSRATRADQCPACREHPADCALRGAPAKRRTDVVVDTRRSSHSTATLSVQTNTTSLLISPSKSSSTTNVVQARDGLESYQANQAHSQTELLHRAGKFGSRRQSTCAQSDKDRWPVESDFVYIDSNSSTSCLSSLDNFLGQTKIQRQSSWSIPSNYGASSDRITVVPTNSDKPIVYCDFHRRSTSCTVDLTEDDILDVFQHDHAAVNCDEPRKLIRRNHAGSLESLSDQFDQETGDESAQMVGGDQVEPGIEKANSGHSELNSPSDKLESLTGPTNMRSISLAMTPARIAQRSHLSQSEGGVGLRSRSLRRTMLLNNHLVSSESTRLASSSVGVPGSSADVHSAEQAPSSSGELAGKTEQPLCNGTGGDHIARLDNECYQPNPRPLSNPSSLAKNRKKQSPRDALPLSSSKVSSYHELGDSGRRESICTGTGEQVLADVGGEQEQPASDSAWGEPDQLRLGAVKQESHLLMSHQADATDRSHSGSDLPSDSRAPSLSASDRGQINSPSTCLSSLDPTSSAKSGLLEQSANAVRKSPTVYLINKSLETS